MLKLYGRFIAITNKWYLDKVACHPLCFMPHEVYAVSHINWIHKQKHTDTRACLHYKKALAFSKIVNLKYIELCWKIFPCLHVILKERIFTPHFQSHFYSFYQVVTRVAHAEGKQNSCKTQVLFCTNGAHSHIYLQWS